MAHLSRFGPTIARSALLNHQRHMATASASTEPVQKLFVEKIREFKSGNKGLDAAHQKAMQEEMTRLKRVYRVEDESKLAQFDYKFSQEHGVSLHDIDESKELRHKIASGEYQRQLVAEAPEPSALLASTPEQVTHDLHLPPLNKPDPVLILQNQGTLQPLQFSEPQPDYEFVGDKMTPGRLEREMLVKFGPEMPTIHDDKSPERDLVNFPRYTQPLDTPPSRHHVIPESWFKFFYPKTGVTGPYAFAATLGTFLFSKEWLIMEHEMLTAFSSTVIFSYAIIKFGPMVSKYLKASVKEEVDGWENWRIGSVDALEKMQKHYKNELQKSEVIKDLYAIRDQDVQLQLEGEYRRRMKTIYEDTRSRLNYLVAVADSQRQIAHKNLINWVITNAVSAIGPKQETEVLDNCILNLKNLARNNANAI